jgi:hypothetical protein
MKEAASIGLTNGLNDLIMKVLKGLKDKARNGRPPKVSEETFTKIRKKLSESVRMDS